MAVKDLRVDAYIAKSAAFARPILKRIRQAVHAACPAVEETIKWGVPHFLYRGMFCGMVALKQHAMFGFWHKGMRDETRQQRLKTALEWLAKGKSRPWKFERK